jgi:hypothetical protein
VEFFQAPGGERLMRRMTDWQNWSNWRSAAPGVGVGFETRPYNTLMTVERTNNL